MGRPGYAERRGVALAVAVGFEQSDLRSGSSAAAHRLPTRLPSTGAAAERVQSVRRTETTGKRYLAALVQVSGGSTDASVALRPSGRAVGGQREDTDPSGEEST